MSKAEAVVTPWTAGAYIWSGSRDPEWAVAAAAAQAALTAWERLPIAERWTRVPSRLGHRGCWLRKHDAGRWTVEADTVLMTGPAGDPVLQVRHDPARTFERMILATAPAGTLPLSVIEAR